MWQFHIEKKPSGAHIILYTHLSGQLASFNKCSCIVHPGKQPIVYEQHLINSSGLKFYRQITRDASLYIL